MSMVENNISTLLEQAQTELSRHIPLETLYRSILDSIQEGVHVLDLNGQILLENEAATRLLGWQGNDLIGKVGHATIHHHYADHSEHPVEDCPILKTLKDGLPRYVEEDVFWRKDGQPFSVEYNTSPLVDCEGHIFGVTVVFVTLPNAKNQKPDSCTWLSIVC